jgi:hypothetical protein
MKFKQALRIIRKPSVNPEQKSYEASIISGFKFSFGII